MPDGDDARTGQRDAALGVRPGAIAWVAAGWGLAEATLFFIVPDVWLTASATRSPRRAMLACLYAVAGALVGGLVMYGFGRFAPEPTIALIERVPAVSPEMVDRVAGVAREHGPLAMFAGLLRGEPYKLHAATAGAQGASLVGFVLVSIAARLLRFAIATGTVCLLTLAVRRRVGPMARLAIVLAFWAVFYAWFFAAMPG